jgi:hypothetical protein
MILLLFNRTIIWRSLNLLQGENIKCSWPRFFKCNECVYFDVLGLEAEKTANNSNDEAVV